MTFAEEIASLWQGIAQKPPKGTEAAYYADLLRRALRSKKTLEETGRKYTILPELRELTRKTLIRVPADHVPYLEISVFDLISNPLKKNLQPYVSEFSATGPDYELVSWLVHHARKEPTLALDWKILDAWLKDKTPAQSTSPSADMPSDSEPSRASPSSSTTSSESAAPAHSDSLSSSDTTVPTPPLSENDGTPADRIFENG